MRKRCLLWAFETYFFNKAISCFSWYTPTPHLYQEKTPPSKSPFVHFPNFLLFSSTGYCQQPLHNHHHHHLSRSILNISNAFVIMANIILIGFTKIDHNNGIIKELWWLIGEALCIFLRFFMNKFWRCFLRVFGLKRLDWKQTEGMRESGRAGQRVLHQRGNGARGRQSWWWWWCWCGGEEGDDNPLYVYTQTF